MCAQHAARALLPEVYQGEAGVPLAHVLVLTLREDALAAALLLARGTLVRILAAPLNQPPPGALRPQVHYRVERGELDVDDGSRRRRGPVSLPQKTGFSGFF